MGCKFSEGGGIADRGTYIGRSSLIKSSKWLGSLEFLALEQLFEQPDSATGTTLGLDPVPG